MMRLFGIGDLFRASAQSAAPRRLSEQEISGQASRESVGDISFVSEGLAITGYDGSAFCKQAGVSAVLSLIDCTRATVGAGGEREVREVVMHPLPEGEVSYEAFRLAVSVVSGLCERHKMVLVHCQSGVNRSVAVSAAYLGKKNGITDPDAAIALVAQNREVACVLPSYRQQLEVYLNQESR